MFRFVKTGGRKDDGEARSIRGVYVGHHERTGASLFLTPEGMIRGTGVHKILEVDRWNDTFLKTVKGLPWKPKTDVRALPNPAYADGEGPPAAPMPIVMTLPPVKERKMYVRRSDLDKYGGTEDCQACMELSSGIKTKCVHTDACRERIMKLMEEDTSNELQQDRIKRRRDQETGDAEAGAAVPDPAPNVEMQSEDVGGEPIDLEDGPVAGSDIRFPKVVYFRDAP